MTVRTAPNRTRPGLQGKSNRRSDSGLITLEWLLIVGAVAGLAATTALTVQQVADDAADIAPDPKVRFIDAEIAAAEISADATQFRLSQIPLDVVNDFNTRGNTANYTVLNLSYSSYEQRCLDLGTDFVDIVSSTRFFRPLEYFEDPGTPPILIVPFIPSGPDWPNSPIPADQVRFEAGEVKAGARCEVRPRA